MSKASEALQGEVVDAPKEPATKLTGRAASLANLRRYEKGTSGNPSGGSQQLAEVQRLARGYGPDVIRRLAEIALGPKVTPMSIRAGEILLDRGFGRAPLVLQDADGNRVAMGVIVLPAPEGEP